MRDTARFGGPPEKAAGTTTGQYLATGSWISRQTLENLMKGLGGRYSRGTFPISAKCWTGEDI